MHGAGATLKGIPMSELNQSKDRLTMTILEAARRLGIGRNSAYEAAHSGEIPTIRIGRRLVVPKAALERMLSGDRSETA